MKLLQASLAGGEMAPGLHGRVDIARYLVSLAKCRNMVTRPTGGAVKRTGYVFRGEVKDSADAARLIPFVYSTEVRYLIEAGDLYFRFWYLDDSQRLFRLESAGVPVEVATPYSAVGLEMLRFTQSADVLYLAHPNHAPRELRRLTSTSFELREFVPRNGPFRPINTNDGIKVAVSAATGIVTVTATDPIFGAIHVGALFYVEEPELRSITPWEPAQRGVGVGSLRRSDGKVYRCSATSSGGGYYVSGSVRPVHDSGRAWDGSGDVRNDGVTNYSVGVEWEFVHAGYGIVQLTGFTDSRTMTGLVTQRIPDSCVGAVAAASSWTLSGDGVTKDFSVPGAVSDSPWDYTVSIDGVGVPH